MRWSRRKWVIVNKAAGYSRQSGTLTMSRSLARFVGTLLYGDTHLPDVAAHEEDVMTFVPSLFNMAMIEQALVRTLSGNS
jgi:hypothetical protein